MSNTYKLEVAGLTRHLPICKVNDRLDIAVFILFGDVDLTIACARELLHICPKFDYIVTPEAKSIPLAYEMSRQSGKPYFVIRKGKKLYMERPVSAKVRSITTDVEQTIFMDGAEGEKLRNRRVLFVDDVISTGESLRFCNQLLNSFDANIVANAAVLAEGDAADRDDIIFLEKLPLFFK